MIGENHLIAMIDYHKYLAYLPEGHPVRHKKKDLYTLNVRITPEYRRRILDILDMDAQLENYLLSLSDYRDLVTEAHAVNVHWSTRIEGNNLSLEEVRESSRRIMASKERLSARDPGPKQEIINHLYSYFFEYDFSLPWGEDVVRGIHRFLMDSTGEDCSPGMIRTEEEMSVYSGDGTETFKACPAIHVAKELGQLLEWVGNSAYDPLITAVVFFHEFESIHPFTEGNGRVGRSLFHILMQELGFRNFNLCKLEDKLVGQSSVYYGLLEYTDSYGDYSPIIEYFVDCITEAYEEALKCFSEKDVLKDLDENGRTLALTSRAEGEWFTVQDAAEWVSGVTEQTVRVKLKHLVSIGVLEKEGHTRSTRFRFCDPFRNVKDIMKMFPLTDREGR